VTVGSRADLAGITAVGQRVGPALHEIATPVGSGIATAEFDRAGARSAPELTDDSRDST